MRPGRLGCDAANAKAPTNHFQPLSPVLVLAPPPITSSPSHLFCPGTPTHHFQPLSPVLVLASNRLAVSPALGVDLFPAPPLKPAEHSCTGALPAWLRQLWSVLTASSLVNACFPSIRLVASFYFPDCLGLPVFYHRRTTHPYFPVTRTVSFVQLGASKYK